MMTSISEEHILLLCSDKDEKCSLVLCSTQAQDSLHHLVCIQLGAQRTRDAGGGAVGATTEEIVKYCQPEMNILALAASAATLLHACLTALNPWLFSRINNWVGHVINCHKTICCKNATICVMQGKNFSQGPPLACRAVSLEKGAHFFWQSLVLEVEKHTDTRLSAPAGSSHLNDSITIALWCWCVTFNGPDWTL